MKKFDLGKSVQHERLLQAILRAAHERDYRTRHRQVFDGGRERGGSCLYGMPCRFLYTEVGVFWALGIKVMRFRIPAENGRVGMTMSLDYCLFDLSYRLLDRIKEKLE